MLIGVCNEWLYKLNKKYPYDDIVTNMKTRIENYIEELRADDPDWPNIVDMVAQIKSYKAKNKELYEKNQEMERLIYR